MRRHSCCSEHVERCLWMPPHSIGTTQIAKSCAHGIQLHFGYDWTAVCAGARTGRASIPAALAWRDLLQRRPGLLPLQLLSCGLLVHCRRACQKTTRLPLAPSPPPKLSARNQPPAVAAAAATPYAIYISHVCWHVEVESPHWCWSQCAQMLKNVSNCTLQYPSHCGPLT